MTDITLEELLANNGAVKTPDARLVLQMPDQKLGVGQHRFSLTVNDDSGNSSTPAIITVIVADTSAPTAVLDLRDEQGRQIIDGRIEFGSGFILDGSRSTDIGGAIESYNWNLLAQ
jgi:hypothetical protein